MAIRWWPIKAQRPPERCSRSDAAADSRVVPACSMLSRVADSDASDDLGVTQSASYSHADPEIATAAPNEGRGTPLRVDETPQFRSSDRYEIISEHGRGGLGRVSRAHDRNLGRAVAIKELISRSTQAEARFLREATITARLEHPNIVPVHETGRWPDGTPFYAMKLVAGRSLRELIAERGTVTERLCLLHHVIAVADAIAYAHDRNVIHRDLKPANVIVGDFGETIVIDWGLAKELSTIEQSGTAGEATRASSEHDLTADGAVLGTRSYMAPEQERGEQVDQRADVFAIGAMLWELCSLQKVPPSQRGLRHRMLRRANIDQDLIAIIDKALAPDAARRYHNAGALAADLKAFKSGARITARTYSLVGMLSHWTRRHRAAAATLASIIVASVVVAVLYVRNIAVERDHADAARLEAVRERRASAVERDRAQLSEAAMWLEKDPTRAMNLLQSNSSESPQRALLRAQAASRSADNVLHVSSRIQTMRAAARPLGAAIVTINGELVRLDIDTGEQRVADQHLSGQLMYYNGRWCYAAQPTVTAPTILSGCGELPSLGPLLRRPTGQLIEAGDALYILEDGNLYRIDPTHPTLVGRNILGFAGSNKLSLTCTNAGKLQIAVGGNAVKTSTCAGNESAHPVAVKGSRYAALRSPTELITDRGIVELASPVRGEYEVMLGDDGLIALGDFAGSAWIVRPDSLRAELVVDRPSHPTVAEAEGSFVAFGYADGTVIVYDTKSGERWAFVGHDESVTQVAIDKYQARAISSAGDEIRIWSLHPTPMLTATSLPCTPFHIAQTSIANVFATDCSDGRALLWSTADNHVRSLHAHQDLAYGVAMHRGDVCTGGWDGKVICTRVGDGASTQIPLGAERVKSFVSCGEKGMFIATAEGAIWRHRSDVREIYRHADMPYRIAADGECKKLASVAYDGSLILYDILQDRVISRRHAHDGHITSVEFRDGQILTAGADGNIREWSADGRTRPLSEWRMTGPVTKFHRLSDGWVASVASRTFVMHSSRAGADLSFTLTHPISDIVPSPDERYIALANLGEIVVLDRERSAVATAHKPGSDIGCLGFTTPTNLAACDTSSILLLSIDDLKFWQIFSGTNQHEENWVLPGSAG